MSFNPTIQDVKDIIECYTVDDKPALCTDEQAEKVLSNWHREVEHQFMDFVESEFMEGDIFNEESE